MTDSYNGPQKPFVHIDKADSPSTPNSEALSDDDLYRIYLDTYNKHPAFLLQGPSKHKAGLRAVYSAAQVAAPSETVAPLDKAILRIEKRRDEVWHEHGGTHDGETNEPIGGSAVADWMEGMDDAIEVIQSLKAGK